VKCPECGFVSFPGLDRCKKCGRRLAKVHGEAKGIRSLFQQPHTATKGPAVIGSESSQVRKERAEQEAGELDIEMKPERPSPSSIDPEENQPAPSLFQTQAAKDWQNELAERVEEYRQRRARLHSSKEGGHETPDLDFGPSVPGPQETRPNVIEFPSSEELERQAKPAAGVRSAPRATGLDNFGSAFHPENSRAEPAPSPKIPSPEETAPLEIELRSSQGNSVAGMEAGTLSGAAGARMSARFFAAVIDALVLLLGAAVYALIFWRVGGHFSLEPLEMGVVALAGAFFILLYFAGCTALASATPGLIWTGLEVTTFEGNPPRLSDCLWRAFGYLVSMSALMLGFIWAAVDADELTWHDRMSRTFVVPADHQ
jgi:uncharacterized RDD family membrane protein YckC